MNRLRCKKSPSIPFASSVSGNGGGGLVDATVADSGAQFSDIQAALDAGHSFLRFTGDLTVGANVNLPDRNIFFWVDDGATIAFGARFMDRGNFAKQLHISGPGTITYDPGVGFNLVVGPDFSGGSQCFINGGIKIENLSSNPITPVFAGDFHQYWDGFTIDGGNNSSAGIRCGQRYDIRNGTFIGGGASCVDILLLSTGFGPYAGKTQNLRFQGTYQANQTIVRETAGIGDPNQANHTQWVFNTDGGTNHSVRIQGSVLDGVLNDSNMTLTIVMDEKSTLKNTQQQNASKLISVEYFDQCIIDNCWLREIEEQGAAAKDFLILTDTRVELVLDIRGTFNAIQNCILEAGASYAAGANDNTLTDSWCFDPDNPSNNVGVTVDVGALRNRFMNVHSDLQITHPNNSTSIINNPVNQGTSASVFQQNVCFEGDIEVAGIGNNLDVQTDGVGKFVGVSDERAKTIHRLARYGLLDLLDINPIVFNYKSDPKGTPENIGFSAQNVKKSIPHAVGVTGQRVDPKDPGLGFLMGLNTRGLLAAVVNALKEIHGRIERLEERGRGK